MLRTAALAALALSLTACASGTEDELDTPDGSPSTQSSEGAAFDWRDTGHPPDEQVVRGPEWSAVVDEQRTEVTLADGDTERTLAAGRGRQVSEVLLDDKWAVAVMQDRDEAEPGRAVVVDLATGERRDVVTPQPASGGSWAMHGGDLFYPTVGDDGAWCIATSALADHNGEDGWCADRRQGWSGLTATPAGVGLMTFDDTRPVACRTVHLLDGTGRPQPVEGPADCTAWDVAAVEGGVVWSEVRRPRQQESAVLRARVGEEDHDLGPGMTGSLLPCGDSVFWTLDPQQRTDPARLLRWRPGHEVEVAYETEARGNAFLGTPACAAGVLTVSSFSDLGDEQVWSKVPVG